VYDRWRSERIRSGARDKPYAGSRPEAELQTRGDVITSARLRLPHDPGRLSPTGPEPIGSRSDLHRHICRFVRAFDSASWAQDGRPSRIVVIDIDYEWAIRACARERPDPRDRS